MSGAFAASYDAIRYAAKCGASVRMCRHDDKVGVERGSCRKYRVWRIAPLDVGMCSYASSTGVRCQAGKILSGFMLLMRCELLVDLSRHVGATCLDRQCGVWKHLYEFKLSRKLRAELLRHGHGCAASS
jgi:hypothetical protein